MAFRFNILEELNELLMHHGLKITMPAAVLKKHAPVINECIRRVHSREDERGDNIALSRILCAIDEHHDVGWFVATILDDESRRIVAGEAVADNPAMKLKLPGKKSAKKS